MSANSRHLKRHTMPTSWPIQRKIISYIARPNPGSHKRDYCISVVALIRDVLKYAKTSREVKYIINHEEMLVNGKKVTDIKTSVGLFDVVEIKKTKEKFTILFDEVGRIRIVNLKDDNLYLRVARKTITKGKKYQLNFQNGFNILVDEKTFKKTNVLDTVVYDFTKKKILSEVPLKEGTFVYVFDGKFKGHFGKVKSFVKYNGVARDIVELELDKATHFSARDYCFAISDKKEDLKRFA